MCFAARVLLFLCCVPYAAMLLCAVVCGAHSRCHDVCHCHLFAQLRARLTRYAGRVWCCVFLLARLVCMFELDVEQYANMRCVWCCFFLNCFRERRSVCRTGVREYVCVFAVAGAFCRYPLHTRFAEGSYGSSLPIFRVHPLLCTPA